MPAPRAGAEQTKRSSQDESGRYHYEKERAKCVIRRSEKSQEIEHESGATVGNLQGADQYDSKQHRKNCK